MLGDTTEFHKHLKRNSTCYSNKQTETRLQQGGFFVTWNSMWAQQAPDSSCLISQRRTSPYTDKAFSTSKRGMSNGNPSTETRYLFLFGKSDPKTPDELPPRTSDKWSTGRDRGAAPTTRALSSFPRVLDAGSFCIRTPLMYTFGLSSAFFKPSGVCQPPPKVQIQRKIIRVCADTKPDLWKLLKQKGWCLSDTKDLRQSFSFAGPVLTNQLVRSTLYKNHWCNSHFFLSLEFTTLSFSQTIERAKSPHNIICSHKL